MSTSTFIPDPATAVAAADARYRALQWVADNIHLLSAASVHVEWHGNVTISGYSGATASIREALSVVADDRMNEVSPTHSWWRGVIDTTDGLIAVTVVDDPMAQS
ncbi:hypothetical protein [Auraticoccus monumenti]|uniref:Uncharacterized protein n=1 Tax=Auraticoccus monumenti TaxID=675864 RepID=A0A1G6USB5_9ACTN|nr:hypothetical protein [Auraticoccus monumenti]SDD43445.1 hypothetical protein SAMN04489747_0940 [Auraticoccus monumenti]